MSFGIIWASLYHLAAREGQYTLYIYLIQIIVIEKLLGPFYKQLVSQSGINWVNEYGLIVKVVSTLVLAAILLGIVMGISGLCHKNQYSMFLKYCSGNHRSYESVLGLCKMVKTRG